MNINVTYGSTITGSADAAEIEGAVQDAVAYYEHAFTNNVTINIDFEFAPLGAGAAAENSFSYLRENYSTVKQIFNSARATSADQATADASVPTTDPTGGGTFMLPTAYAKMLGLAAANSSIDDTVTLNSNLTWNFNPTARAGSSESDAIGALEHEMSEGGMGRVQALGMTGRGNEQNENGDYAPLDLFRYASTGARDLTDPSRDVAEPNGAFFSINGGSSLLEQYNDPTKGGDAADWAPSIKGDSYGDNYPGLDAVTPTDLIEENALGWTRRAATVDDFNGDAVSDILFYDQSNGRIAYDEMNGSIVGSVSLPTLSKSYTLVGVGDFVGNYTDDILFRNNKTGALGYYNMDNGDTVSGKGGSQAGNAAAGTVIGGLTHIGRTNPAYAVVGTGDFYGTGADDILLRNSSTGDMGFYEMSKGAAVGGFHDLGLTSTAYSVAGVGDFYGNGVDDILLRDSANGDMGYYKMSNGAAVSGFHDLGSTSTAYSVAGVGDFTGAGTDDILLRNNSTGDMGFYEMSNGAAVGGYHDIGGSSTAYSVAAVGDYLGNGLSDILLRNASTGDMGFYEMSKGVAVGGFHDLGVTSTAFAVPTLHTGSIA